MNAFFLFLILCLPSLASEDDVAKLSRMVKQRKEELKLFKAKVTKGDRCPVRDYECFSREALAFVKGNTEDLIQAPSILEPFFERSVKEGFPPCSDTCENTLLASHVKLFLDYLQSGITQANQTPRTPPYPTVSSVRARTYLDLTAYTSIVKHKERLSQLLVKLDFGKVTKPELTNKKAFELALEMINLGEFFKTSVLCHLAPGDPVYDPLKGSKASGKSVDETYALWMKQFEETGKASCQDTSPLIYRGTDKGTRAYYRAIRDEKLSGMKCEAGDFGCFRKVLRDVRIHYAEDVEVVGKRLIRFMKDSRTQPCDDTCMAQSLVRMIQTFITFLSTFEREKLASTMDWKEFPDAKFSTIQEDIEFYQSLKKFMLPIISTFGKIDPKNIQDAGLRSELRSVSRDLSEFASGKMLKDSVICTMEPWTASYDKYLSPYADKAKNKKFEEAFLEFKSSVCK